MIILRKLKKDEKYILHDSYNSGIIWDLSSTNPQDALEEALDRSGFSVSIDKEE